MAESEVPQEEETIPFFPDHILTEAKVAVAILALLVIVGALAFWSPIGLGEPADPMVTPAHTKPEWYFLFLFQLLKYIPKTAGVLLPILGLLVLTFWPFLDRKQDTKRARSIRLILAIVVMVAVIVLTILGEFT